jgi:hypothetical protein
MIQPWLILELYLSIFLKRSLRKIMGNPVRAANLRDKTEYERYCQLLLNIHI